MMRRRMVGVLSEKETTNCFGEARLGGRKRWIWTFDVRGRWN
jgi:hypothetical protein